MLTGFVSSEGVENGQPRPAAPGMIGARVAGGGYGLVRLRGGSVRMGYAGSVYLFDDLDGIGRRILDLRRIVTARNAGIMLSFDGRGVPPDPATLIRLSETLAAGAMPLND